MKKAIIAKKIGMTQVFTENGALVPVTVLEGKESNKAHEGSFHKSRRSC